MSIHNTYRNKKSKPFVGKRRKKTIETNHLQNPTNININNKIAFVEKQFREQSRNLFYSFLVLRFANDDW